MKLYDFNPIIVSNRDEQFEGVANLPLAGSAARIIDQLHAYEAAGMHQIVSGFTAEPFGPMNEQLEKMQQVAEEVLQPFRSGT